MTRRDAFTALRIAEQANRDRPCKATYHAWALALEAVRDAQRAATAARKGVTA
jgi:hypothetical protein